MHVLKDYSIARSSTADEKAKKADSAAPVAEATAVAPKSPGAKEISGATVSSIPPKAKTPKPVAQNCELVGKSPEDQASTLQRCVNMVDPPKGKTGSR
ncbi:hypothetical protein [Propionivibrio sp.]|uniref:hypothetical protein n=1 Tax=Propionivibrio sp. TaxID=2212460 RepID=UPI003BF131C0